MNLNARGSFGTCHMLQLGNVSAYTHGASAEQVEIVGVGPTYTWLGRIWFFQLVFYWIWIGTEFRPEYGSNVVILEEVAYSPVYGRGCPAGITDSGDEAKYDFMWSQDGQFSEEMWRHYSYQYSGIPHVQLTGYFQLNTKLWYLDRPTSLFVK